ncbi:MAG: hypothetical protein RLZ45_1095 [Verrucomicrobiota bacterium]|jgi:formylglycine-generating enzyme required for sulfatase activity
MRFFVTTLLLCLGTTLARGQGSAGKHSPPQVQPALTPPKHNLNSVSTTRKTSVKSTTSANAAPAKEGDDFYGSGLGNKGPFKWISPGTFDMGSTSATDPDRGDDETPHKVTLTKGFWLLDHEVTQSEYKVIMGKDSPSRHKGVDRPVEQISWIEANEFCKALTLYDRVRGMITDQQEYRLPTEAEWEYACRATTKTAVYINLSNRRDELNRIAHWKYYPGKKKATRELKKLDPNLWGLYDMIGNVAEWCSDWYGSYPSDPQTVSADPTGPSSGTVRVVRGGGWGDDEPPLRSASRQGLEPWERTDGLGLRPALSSVRQAQ